MNIVDIIVLGILLLNGILGAIRGFAIQAFRIGSIVLAIYLAHTRAADLAAILGNVLESWPHAQRVALAWVIIGIATYLGMSVLGHFARRQIEKLRLGSADRALGFILGGLKGAALCVIAFQVISGFGPILPATFEHHLLGNRELGIEPSRAFQVHVETVKPYAEAWTMRAHDEWAKQTGAKQPR
jgi:membrane protein required for colicin V production